MVSGLAESPRLRLGEAPRREGQPERAIRTVSRIPRDSEGRLFEKPGHAASDYRSEDRGFKSLKARSDIQPLAVEDDSLRRCQLRNRRFDLEMIFDGAQILGKQILVVSCLVDRSA